jgi:hypothetical protein
VARYLSANIVKGVYGFNTSGYVNQTVDGLFARAGFHVVAFVGYMLKQAAVLMQVHNTL